MTAPPENVEVWVGFGLFFVSEVVGMSRLRDNSLLQLILHMASELFPYELQRRERPTHANRPRMRRDEHGRFQGRQRDQ